MIELAVATAAFMAALGTFGLISRRNLAFIVLSLELILNSAILLLVIFLPKFEVTANAVSSAILLLAIGASEVAFGFALAVALARRHKVSDVLTLSELGGKVER